MYYKCIIAVVWALLSGSAAAIDQSVRIGFTPTPKFVEHQKNGAPHGLYVDILQEALVKRLNYQIEYVPLPQKRLPIALQSGKIDAFIDIKAPGVVHHRIDVPVSVGTMSVFSYANHPEQAQLATINTLADLDDWHILSFLGDSWTEDHLTKEHIDDSATNQAQVFQKLARQRGDITITQELVGLSHIQELQLSDKIIITSRLTTNPVLHYLYYSERAQTLLDKSQIEKTLSELLRNGTVQDIYRKHLATLPKNLIATDDSSKVRIAVHSQHRVKELLDHIASHQAQNPQQHIPTITPLTYGFSPYEAAIQYALYSHNPPELLMSWPGYRLKQLIINNQIKPFTKNLSIIKQYKPKAIKSATNNNQIYGFPWSQHIIPVIYNHRIFAHAKLNYPHTLTELVTNCQSFRNKDVVPIALGGTNKWPVLFWLDYLLLSTSGKEFRQTLIDGKLPLNHANVKNAIEHWQTLVQHRCFNGDAMRTDFDTASKRVIRGEAAMTIMGTWMFRASSNTADLEKNPLDFALFPVKTDSTNKFLLNVFDVLVQTNTDKDPQVAQALEYLGSKDAQINWSNSNGSVSVRIDIRPEDYAMPHHAKTTALEATASDLIIPFDLATRPEISDALFDVLRAVFLGDTAIDKLLDVAESKRLGQ